MNQENVQLHAALAVMAALLYLGASARQLMHLDRRGGMAPPRDVLYLALAAVTTHLVIVLMSFEQDALAFGIYKVSSLIFLTMAMISLATLIKRPLHLLMIATFPLAALAVLLNAFAPATGRTLDGLGPGMVLHISSALLAFGVLTLATLQAALVSMQTHKLRQRQTRGIIQLLPALDLMERMFYELLIAGFGLLTIAVVAGGVFIDDILAQQIAHKTVLTLLAWLVFLILIVVRWRSGWRIGTALSLVFVGYTTLTLGFFGSKLVLELIL